VNTFAVIDWAIPVSPAAVFANECNVAVKMDNGKTNFCAHHKGEETLSVKPRNCSQLSKERVRMKINDKDGKVREIAPSE